VEAPLRRALVSGVRQARLAQTLLDKWERSLTEQEARMAMAFHRKQPSALAYLRTIDSVELLPVDFCDRDDVDYEAITDLRIKLWSDVQSQLPDHHRQLKADLVDGEVSERYLAGFCETVLQDLTQAAATEFSRPNFATSSGVEREAHRSSIAWSGKPEPRLAERGIELTFLLNYLQSPSRYPLIIVGESGSGKSTFLSYAGGKVRQQQPHWRVIQRFIGRTPDSTDQRRLLRGLCEEMDEHYRNEDPVPESFTQLADGLRRRLMRIPPERPLLLLLDGLDQVQRADIELLLSFIPSVIPTSVRLVVSVVEDCSPLQPLLQKYFSLRGQDIRESVHHLRARYPAEAFLTLGGLTPLAAESLAEGWLGDRSAPRRRQPAQLSVLMNGFRACSLPLYLRVATEEAAQLRSGDEACFPESLTALCQQLFDRLSKPQNHSPRLVQRVLGYLLSATHGLAEDELLELIARDADFMAGFRRRSESLGQPLQQNLTSLPSAVWARLYHDLEPFLVTRNVGGIHLIDLFHQGMENAAAQWVNSATRAKCQINLINYFRQQDTWADSLVVRREKVLSIPPQTRTANMRKILELPTLLIRHVPSRKTLKESLLDPDFLEALCESGRVDQLVEALRVSSRFHDQRDISKPDEVEISLFRLAVVIMAHRDFLERHPTSLFQTLYNYFHFSVEWGEVNHFLNRWKIHRQTNTPGFPWIRYRSTPPLQDVDTSLTLSFRHDAPIEALAVSPAGGYIACGDSRGEGWRRRFVSVRQCNRQRHLTWEFSS
jgi:AAA ATPase-like protein